MAYDKRHGGPYDRGAADSWYRRRFRASLFGLSGILSW